MSINESREFFFESYFKGIEFFKENNYYSMKRLTKKIIVACKQINNIPHNRNDKKHYQSFMKKKTQNQSKNRK